ncbi:UDP-N-acetylglucosamine transferase subunit ALG14 homolog [Daktulosphaira vitifoliae]|uniref:UDP-N-acetylglucosamine transferase subunit ALG14 homolog n=1 Tax=Daktulosphaira vitifoliae TaxID=58002 RepID=UPI0021A97E54|nr:UDP-N-acetylglucosamine transferase subunit ALG14 homolog [Daktulosphaira vitifoliae]
MNRIFLWLFVILILISLYFTVRLMCLIYKLVLCPRSIKEQKNPLRTLIVIGSGGHTSEMLRLVQNLNRSKFMPRLYVMADTDTTSMVQVMKHEENYVDWTITTIPRSRHINQTYSSSILSTLYSIVMSMPVVLSFKPEIVLCNGPGTCVPICLIAFIMRLFHLTDTSIIFIESICRVKSLSLTGKIMLFFADLIIVQWPELQQKYSWRVKYFKENN